jgi:hypothetical protein
LHKYAPEKRKFSTNKAPVIQNRIEFNKLIVPTTAIKKKNITSGTQTIKIVSKLRSRFTPKAQE